MLSMQQLYFKLYVANAIIVIKIDKDKKRAKIYHKM